MQRNGVVLVKKKKKFESRCERHSALRVSPQPDSYSARAATALFNGRRALPPREPKSDAQPHLLPPPVAAPAFHFRRAPLPARGGKDYYATLNVPRDATLKEVKSAYRTLARKVLLSRFLPLPCPSRLLLLFCYTQYSLPDCDCMSVQRLEVSEIMWYD